MKTLLCVSLSLVITASMFSQTTTAQTPTANSVWNQLVDEFFNSYFQINPTNGTASGFHQYDSQLEDYSHAGVEKQIAWAKVL